MSTDLPRGAPTGPLSPEDVERNKDKLDLRPNVSFVSTHIGRYEEGLASIFRRVPSDKAKQWAEGLKINESAGEIINPQLNPGLARAILSRMPQALIDASTLETIDYTVFGQGSDRIPVPGFDEQGKLDQKKIQLVPLQEFPRAGDHPGRVLVGISNGVTIYPTAIPESVSHHPRAIFLYQAHVMLHEFFHTVEMLRRAPEHRRELKFEVDSKEFTFEEWWDAFDALMLSGEEPDAVSRYAGTYTDTLTQQVKDEDPVKYTKGLAEQICETFVAYQLGIISNDKGWTDFRSESFGNVKMEQKFVEGTSKAANKKWLLMDKLCRSSLLQ